MSFYSYMYDCDRPRRHGVQNYAIAFTPDEMMGFVGPQYIAPGDHNRSWKRQMANALRDNGCSVKCDKTKFQVTLDVQHFVADEISVKTIDGHIIIQAKHEEKRDSHGWVSRQFTRKYALPAGCNADHVQCRLSSDGVMNITVPMETAQKANERVVQIIHTGPMKPRQEPPKPETAEEEAVPKAAGENGS